MQRFPRSFKNACEEHLGSPVTWKMLLSRRKEPQKSSLAASSWGVGWVEGREPSSGESGGGVHLAVLHRRKGTRGPWTSPDALRMPKTSRERKGLKVEGKNATRHPKGKISGLWLQDSEAQENQEF